MPSTFWSFRTPYSSTDVGGASDSPDGDLVEKGGVAEQMRIAYATVPGDWVRLYVDVRSPAQRKAAEALGKAMFQAFGKIEAVKPAKVEVSGMGGKYTVSVDGGKTMKFVTEPILQRRQLLDVAFPQVESRHLPSRTEKSPVASFPHQARLRR